MRPIRFYGSAIALFAFCASTLSAVPATETVLHSFKYSSNSAYPLGRLRFINGSLYGTGSGNWMVPTYGQVFKFTNVGGTWKKMPLLSFHDSDGNTPYGTVIQDSNGVLYGTTSLGDAYNAGNVFTLYRKNGSWVHKTLWAFGGTSSDGQQPLGDLVMDNAGNLYGTTYYGGASNVGTVFQLSKSGGTWNETVLVEFAGTSNGNGPLAGLLLDRKSGTLYGTTYAGGYYNNGIIFKLTRSRGVWKESVLYSFMGHPDGEEPTGILISDSKGALYGTTQHGGTLNAGTVFKLFRSGGAWNETQLHSFGSQSYDGSEPVGGLRWSGAGTLYGTTGWGGTAGRGTVFELKPSRGVWKEKVLHNFGSGTDGAFPQYDQVILDKSGNLFGTTLEGGADNAGTVWEVVP